MCNCSGSNDAMLSRTLPSNCKSSTSTLLISCLSLITPHTLSLHPMLAGHPPSPPSFLSRCLITLSLTVAHLRSGRLLVSEQYQTDRVAIAVVMTSLGSDSNGTHKPVPGKALLPAIEPLVPSSSSHLPFIMPTPPSGIPPKTGTHPTSQFLTHNACTHDNHFFNNHSLAQQEAQLSIFCTGRFKPPAPGSKTLPPLESAPARETGPRYEWVDVGMLEYNPDTKQYLVKRAFVPNHILEKNNKKVEGKSGGGSDGEGSVCTVS